MKNKELIKLFQDFRDLIISDIKEMLKDSTEIEFDDGITINEIDDQCNETIWRIIPRSETVITDIAGDDNEYDFSNVPNDILLLIHEKIENNDYKNWEGY